MSTPAVTEAGDPCLDPLAANAQATEPIVKVLGRRRTIGPEVGFHGMHPCLVEIRHASPARVAFESLEGGSTVPHGPEAHVSLPGERLQQRLGIPVEDDGQVPELRPSGDRRPKLFPRQRSIGERLSDCGAQGGHRMAGGCSSSAARSSTFDLLLQSQVSATVLRGHQMRGAAKRERLDDPSRGQGTSDIAHPGPFASGTDGELGGGLELGLHSTKSANDASTGRRRPVNQLLPHSPLGPGQFSDGIG
jgi:hypothetical protein